MTLTSGRLALLVVITCVLPQASTAYAQPAKPTALVFAPRASQGRAAKDEALVTREVRAAVERSELADLLPEPSLDLEAMQLAIDCVGESVECLGEVAKRSKTRVLLVPFIERSAGMTSLRILYFDARSEEAPRSVQRSTKGKHLDGSVFDAIPEMLRELFPVEAEPEEVEPDPAPIAPVVTEPIDIQPEPEARQRLPIAPLIVAGGGLVVLAAGVTVGILMKNTQDDYAARKVETVAQAMQANADRERGRKQAVVANVLLGVGAAALLVGGVWFALGLSSERKPAPQAMLVPTVSTESAGLALVGVWEDRL